MKTTAITVERNYRIDNQDQYMKARLSHTVEPQGNETMEACTELAIKMLDNVFRTAYPHVDEHLNFHVEIQVNKVFVDGNKMKWIDPLAPTNYAVENQPQLSQKESIIRDINSCSDIKILESYKLIAKTDPDFQTAYDNKLNQLQNATRV